MNMITILKGDYPLYLDPTRVHAVKKYFTTFKNISRE